MGCLQEEVFPGCTACLRIFINLMTIAAFVLSFFVATTCKFFDFKVNDEVHSLPDLGGIDSQGSIGLFHYLNDEDDCMDYPQDYNFDGSMGTARVGSIIAVFAGGLSLICTLSEALCCALGIFCAIPTAFFLLIAVLGQCLAYSIFSTESICDVSDCSFSKGAAYNTAAFSLYFCACFLMCICPTGGSLLAQLKKKQKAKNKAKQKELDEKPKPEGEETALEKEKEGPLAQEGDITSTKSAPMEEGLEIDSNGSVTMATSTKTNWM